jgi:benzoate/toluate 1,2-dioxygenase alpha subunit
MSYIENQRNLLDEKPEGPRRLDRSIFTDPELFELEFKNIWEKVWVYVAHQSELPAPRSFVTRWVGRIPVIINRNKNGELGALANICSHRGTTLCRVSKGTRTNFVCPFHGWTFDGDGTLLAPMNEEGGGYPPGFKKQELGLRRMKLGNYKGFLFASLNSEVEPLEDYLANAKAFVDILVDESPEGIEILKGSSTYTFNGNWKLQAENGVDGYHVAATHGNYVETIQHRAVSNAKGEKTRAMNAGDVPNSPGGFYDLGNGHTILWSEWSNPQDRPLYRIKNELAARIGKVRADWAVGRLRNMLIYPNVFFMDQMSSQIRVFRPLAVDKTEVTIYCFAPRGEANNARAHRIRQYEDFFNATGMATPDDLAEFEACAKGYEARAIPLQGYERGMSTMIAGPDQYAKELGVHPVSSGHNAQDEVLYYGFYRTWAKMLGVGQ